MDITPKPPSTPEVVSKGTSTLSRSQITSIEELKPVPGKQYQATVQAPPPKTNQEQPVIEGKAATVNTHSSKEWLLNINGKLVTTTSSIPLEIGQTLLVKLESSSTQQSKALILVSPTNRSTAQIPADKGSINTEILLGTLAKLLPKQLSLGTGFAALNEMSKATSQTPPISQNQTKVASAQQTQLSPTQGSSPLTRKVALESIATLIKSLPHAEQISQASRQGDTLSSPDTIRNALKHSGLFMESQLSNTTNKQQILEQLQNLKTLNKIALAQADQTKPTANNPLSGTPSPQNTNQTSAAVTKQALDMLQQLVKQHSNTAADPSQDKTISSDLKATLLGISRNLLPAANSSGEQNQAIEKLLGSLLEPELLTTPFNFPRIQSDTTAKAKALFAEQEFSTGQLLKILAGMLNRIQFNQLNSLFQSQTSDGNTLQSWFFELPVVNVNQGVTTFSLRLDKEKSATQNQEEESEDKALQWKISLSFDLEGLGAIYIQVSLLPPSISSIIWADQADTFALAQKESKHFKEKLSELGLEVGDIICQQGLPEQQATKLTQSLVDIQA